MFTKQRVVVYIDGFNLYHGLRDANLLTSRWLDLHAMSEALLKPHQCLAFVRYFTTRVRNDPAAARRQAVFIDAIQARGGVEIDYGHFLTKSRRCHLCGHSWQQSEEKKTDVNIAVRLLNDAYDGAFDVAIVISGDSDLVPPVQSVRSRFPEKGLVVAFPPQRSSSDLRKTAHASFTISKNVIRNNRLPDPVITASGLHLKAPKGWTPTLSGE